MNHITDYKCTYDFDKGIDEEFTKKLDLIFPDAYCHKDSIVKLAKAQKEYQNALFCDIPFCHTLEAEAMGAIINLGDAKTGPRAKDYLVSSAEDILALPDIDFSKGRIHETLLAAEELVAEGENVVFYVTGPLTALDALIDPRFVFKTMKKNPELAKAVFWKIGEETLKLMQFAYERGVRIISYADSSGGVNILGPKLMQQMVDDFLADFLKKMDEELPKDMLVLLCPKISLALIGTEKADFEDAELDEAISFGDAIVDRIGKTRFLGHLCVKDSKKILQSKRIKQLVLR